MKVLVLGATGLLGAEVMAALKERGLRAYGAARSGADLKVDVTNQMALFRLLCRVDADAVINCAANVNLGSCEADIEAAYRVNGAPAGVLAAWSRQTEGRFLQISTDHFFTGDLPLPHDEHAMVSLVNAYAVTKFAAESMARKAENSLTIRTNICGAKKGFGRWALDCLRGQKPMNLFADYFTSTMHVGDCAAAIVELLVSEETGLINLASRDISSKSDFIRALAAEMNIDPSWVTETTARDLTPIRALSCGLDVSKAETVLGRKLPSLQNTVRSLVHEDAQCATTTNSKSATALSA